MNIESWHTFGVSRASFPFVALLMLALSVMPSGATASDPLRIDSSRPPKSVAAGDFLGATHPDVEITARPAGGALGRFWAAERATSRSGLVRGTSEELRNLVELGLVGGLQRVVEMWDAGVISEGVVGSEVEAWHGAGWTGQGIRIGVLDSSFAGSSTLLGSELPTAVTVASFHAEGLERGTNKHGTAVAEIIHDVAPGAELVLVNAGADRLSEAVDFFIAEDVDVINLSGGWSVGPFDGTADQDIQANRAIDAGIVWVNAAGNEADPWVAASTPGSARRSSGSSWWARTAGSASTSSA